MTKRFRNTYYKVVHFSTYSNTFITVSIHENYEDAEIAAIEHYNENLDLMIQKVFTWKDIKTIKKN